MSYLYSKACDTCGSQDNLAVYDDGEWCFTPECPGNVARNRPQMSSSGQAKRAKSAEPFLPQGRFQDLTNRGISSETCAKYGYHYTKYTGKLYGKKKQVQDLVEADVAVYDVRGGNGNLLSQKLRGPNKSFKWINYPEAGLGLLGAEMWEQTKRRLIITEGIEDMLACAEATEFKMNVSSVPDGAGSAEKVFLRDYDKIMRHDQIILFPDNDEDGQSVIKAAKKVFPPYKLSVIDCSYKDACEVSGRQECISKECLNELKFLILQAKPTPPLTLLRGIDVSLSDLMKPARVGFHVPTFPGLDYHLNGFAKGEGTLWVGGAKLGKTDALSRIEYHLAKDYKQKIADIKVESSTINNILQFIALDLKIPFKILKENPEPYRELIEKSKNELLPYFNFYQHSGRCSPQQLLDLVYYCHAVDKVDFVVIDNLTKAISGAPASKDGERKDIDMFVSDLMDFVKNTGVGVHLVCHLKNPERGRSWLQGKMVTDLGQIRGSGNIGNLFENVITVGGQIKPYKDTVFDKDVRYLGVLATREGRDPATISDFYKLNKETWEPELCACPWEDVDTYDE